MPTLTTNEQLQCINAIMDELADLSITITLVSNGNQRVHSALTGFGSTHYKLTQILDRLRTPAIIDLEESIMVAYEEATWD